MSQGDSPGKERTMSMRLLPVGLLVALLASACQEEPQGGKTGADRADALA
jgi:hypothetical protein